MSTRIKPSLASAPVLCTFFCAFFCALLATTACAEDLSAAAGAQASPAASPLRGKAVDQRELAQQRGGSDAASLSDLRLTGSVTGNSASNLTTGGNIITDGALNGVSGVPMVIQNSGNNVLIQSATIINVTVK